MNAYFHSELAAMIGERAERRGLAIDLDRLRYANRCLYDGIPSDRCGRVLYAGVGHGHDALLALLDNKAESVVGVDPYIGEHGNNDDDRRALQVAIDAFGFADRFTLVRARIEDYAAQAVGPFDCIFFNDVLHHIFVTEKRLRDDLSLQAAIDLFRRLVAASSAGAILVIGEAERHGLRPLLSQVGVLPGKVDYRTKQPRGEWTAAATAGGWTLVRQANYVPWRLRAQRTLWSGRLGRSTLCDKYFLWFERQPSFAGSWRSSS
jgi:hypothetical protein